MEMKMFAFIQTSIRRQVICKEVNTVFVKAVAVIHMHDRYRAEQKFNMEHSVKAFGRLNPIYSVVHEM